MLRLLVGQWQLKLISLALAVGLWLFVASTEPREIMLAVPVEYVGLEGPLTLDGPRREAVDVQVHATRWAAGAVSPATVRVRVDVSRLRRGPGGGRARNCSDQGSSHYNRIEDCCRDPSGGRLRPARGGDPDGWPRAAGVGGSDGAARGASHRGHSTGGHDGR